MNWEEKFEAIRSLADGACLKMREPGDWYVCGSGVEVSEGAMLAGRYGNGKTPQEAVEDHWRQWTEGAPLLVKDAYSAHNERTEWRWNGYRWAQQPKRNSAHV